jgi:hypothetical protein
LLVVFFVEGNKENTVFFSPHFRSVGTTTLSKQKKNEREMCTGRMRENGTPFKTKIIVLIIKQVFFIAST